MGIILRALRDSCLGVALSTPKPRRTFMGRSPYSGASGMVLSPEPRTAGCGHGVGKRHHWLRASRTRPREMVNNTFRACLACLTGCERRNLWFMVGASHHNRCSHTNPLKGMGIPAPFFKEVGAVRTRTETCSSQQPGKSPVCLPIPPQRLKNGVQRGS